MYFAYVKRKYIHRKSKKGHSGEKKLLLQELNITFLFFSSVFKKNRRQVFIKKKNNIKTDQKQ